MKRIAYAFGTLLLAVATFCGVWDMIDYRMLGDDFFLMEAAVLMFVAAGFLFRREALETIFSVIAAASLIYLGWHQPLLQWGNVPAILLLVLGLLLTSDEQFAKWRIRRQRRRRFAPGPDPDLDGIYSEFS